MPTTRRPPAGGIAAMAWRRLAPGDQWNNRIRVVAERTGTFYGRAMKAGDIYTIAGGGAGSGFFGDGGPATKAGLSLPSGVAFAAGNLLICDSGSLRIRMVTSSPPARAS